MQQQPLQSEQKNNPDQERLFTDPTLAQTAAEDPLFKFLSTHWKQVLLLIGAVLAGYFGNQSFQETYLSSMRRSGELFSNLQKQIDQIDIEQGALLSLREEAKQKSADAAVSEAQKEEIAKNIKEKEQSLIKLQERSGEMITALSDSREPYNELALLYRQLLQTRAANAASIAQLQPVRSDWENVDAKSAERFISEASAFNAAGLKLDRADSASQASETLKNLSKNGVYLHVPAALRLARIASTVEQRAEALIVLEELSTRMPEQSSVLQAEIARLKP